MAKYPPSTPPPNHLPIPKPHPQTPDPKLGPGKIFEISLTWALGPGKNFEISLTWALGPG